MVILKLVKHYNSFGTPRKAVFGTISTCDGGARLDCDTGWTEFFDSVDSAKAKCQEYFPDVQFA